MRILTNSLLSVCLILILYSLSYCSSDSPENKYLNLSDTVEYVGTAVCKNCHYDKHQTFMHTGMGQSFGLANKAKSAANIHPDSILYDTFSNLYYHPFWDADSLKLQEYRISGKNTVHNRIEQVDYIIGSGQHTNSHIYNVNGYLHQMPFTYYTQEGRFDLPPGFEEGFNTRFNRKIGLECMSCHNSLPDFVMGSENKFEKVHMGISCERCHGPGELHVSEKMNGVFVDTSLYTDYTIVNPGNISAELQFEICSRCHLQGNTVLEDGKSFFDFKPGMHLNEVMNVFLPEYEGDDAFIMASHVERLKMSECFIQSKGDLTCITCHNPHLSVTLTSDEVFNASCISCHQESDFHTTAQGSNCIDCHMPTSGSSDIPHVRVTDHKISIPQEMNATKQESLKKFIGLYCVNNDAPSDISMLKAYLQQYEKFEQKTYYLDSALVYLTGLDERLCPKEWVQYYFFREAYTTLVSWFEQKSFEQRKNQFNKKSYTNDDAWAWYRVGEAYYKLSNWEKASLCFSEAADLAPFHLEIQNKYAMALLRTNRLLESKKVFEFVISENPKFEKVYANYGYLLSRLGSYELAAQQYEKGIALNPDLVHAWLNYAAYYMYKENTTEAKKCLMEVLRIEPEHRQAKLVLEQLR